jgi:hypothetical protein
MVKAVSKLVIRLTVIKNMKKVIFLLTLILSGCATTANYEKLLSSWVGSPESALISSWGPPSSVYESDGTKYLTYSKSNSGYIPGVAPSYQTRYVGNTAYTTPIGGYSGFVYNNNCSTTFTVSNKTITNWRYEGNACRSR